MPRRALRVVLWLLGVFVIVITCGSNMPREHIAMETVVLPAAPKPCTRRCGTSSRSRAGAPT
ncbi:hypothetical protein [Nannocystis pusilla]|uniref:hypothetical protein n=1 Tax=Nannocystis pusilla TaxID=889268 RepID=UPI003B7C0365